MPSRPKVGDVIQVALPGSRHAHGRILRDASVAFYSTTSRRAGEPPIGSRDFAFTVGVYNDVVAACPVVGHDALAQDEDGWPPPARVTDPITGDVQIYERGEMRLAGESEDPTGMEPAAVWDLHHLVDRLAALPL